MKYLLITLLLLLSACTLKQYDVTETKVIVLKTKMLKFADLGYLRHNGDALELELFVAGKSVFSVSIDYLICTDGGCMSKKAFNEAYLHKSYPDTLFEKVLLGLPIYNAQNYQIIKDGFEQKVLNDFVDISYRVTSKITYFKDRKNHILLKIKEST